MADGKMRVSLHSGRERSARHNDRSFLRGKSPEWIAEHAPHIDIMKTASNCYWTWDGTDRGFMAAERRFYIQELSEGQEQTNQRYIREGHRDRCKSVDDLYKDEKTCPEEVILQIGDKDADINPELFKACVYEYMQQLQAWSKQHGDCLSLLSMACHFDEVSPHAHLSRCWTFKDKHGHRKLGQNAALKAAGINLPHPEKPEGRHNNRKMAFDQLARGWWQDICKSHGLEIETEPLPNRRTHKKKYDFLYGKMSEIVQAADQAKEQAAALQSQLSILDQMQEAIQEAPGRRGLLGYHIIKDAEYKAIIQAAAGYQAALDGLHDQIEDMQRGYQQQLDALEEMRKQVDREIGEKKAAMEQELATAREDLAAEKAQIDDLEALLATQREELDQKPLIKLWKIRSIIEEGSFQGGSIDGDMAQAKALSAIDKGLKDFTDQIIDFAIRSGLDEHSAEQLRSLDTRQQHHIHKRGGPSR